MLKTSKFSAALLIVAFLSTTIGSAFGFAICDHGVLSKTHLHNHQKGEHFDLYDAVAHSEQSASLSEKIDTCQDLSLHAKDGILEASETIKAPLITLHAPHPSSSFELSENRQTFESLFNKENPKIPHYILSLRTTILLI